ncbi:hypothetical protein VKT23_004838 [Stygiomarasmius scandens]|uniref:Uncharacterized protein n=1 Tax=Marasmiellus scandens TaxID=2682957 RepID=A0ABR1JTF0_9AGAR
MARKSKAKNQPEPSTTILGPLPTCYATIRGTCKCNMPTNPDPGSPIPICRMHNRSLETWIVHFNLRHLADGLPITDKPAKYRELLYELRQRHRKGPVFGKVIKGVPPEESDWPRQKYVLEKEMREREERERMEREGYVEVKPFEYEEIFEYNEPGTSHVQAPDTDYCIHEDHEVNQDHPNYCINPVTGNMHYCHWNPTWSRRGWNRWVRPGTARNPFEVLDEELDNHWGNVQLSSSLKVEEDDSKDFFKRESSAPRQPYNENHFQAEFRVKNEEKVVMFDWPYNLD